MLTIQSFTFNPFQENTYLLYNEHKELIIVDPGMYDVQEQETLFSFIEKNNLIPKMLLCTHTHIDHVFGVEATLGKYNIPFGFHISDKPVFDAAASAAAMYGLQYTKPPQADFYIEENGFIELGIDKLKVLFCPGHSPGSVCFYHAGQNFLIAGDVIFQMSVGRTDLPGGDYDTLMNSIHTQLMHLPPDTTIYSGHGPATHIGFEKMNNPFLVKN